MTRALLLLAVAVLPGRAVEPLKLARTIPLPGVEGRIDHLSVDVLRRRLFVAALGNNTLEVVDLKAGQCIQTIKGLHAPQGVLYVQALNRIYVANGEDFSMALDWDEHRLFVGCRKPAQVAVLDTNTGKILAQFDSVGDTDDLFYDSALKRLYVSGGEGFLSVFQEQDPDRYTYLTKIPTAAGARTSLFVPVLKRFYLAVPHRGAQAAEVRVYETQP